MSITLGLLLYSFHPENKQATEDFTPGVYVTQNEYSLGVFRNSYGKVGLFSTYRVDFPKLGSVSLELGGIHGYTYKPILPLVVFTYKPHNNLKLGYVPPTPFSSKWGTLTFSLEF